MKKRMSFLTLREHPRSAFLKPSLVQKGKKELKNMAEFADQRNLRQPQSYFPSKLGELEFYDWLERASVEDLEAFSKQTA